MFTSDINGFIRYLLPAIEKQMLADVYVRDKKEQVIWPGGFRCVNGKWRH